MAKIKSLCVFCGARNGVAQDYVKAAEDFGRMMVEQDITLVYGGGDCGLMGAVANSVMEGGGKVVGVFPVGLRNIENEHMGLTEIIIVDSMHERKKLMFDRSDAFITFPGGYGTMDETFEIITWRLLQFHHKPVIIYNHNGYWNPWLALTEQIEREGFASPEARYSYNVVDTIDKIIPTVSDLLEE